MSFGILARFLFLVTETCCVRNAGCQMLVHSPHLPWIWTCATTCFVDIVN